MPLRAFPALDQHEFRDACLALLRSLESVDLVVDPTDHLEVELRSHNNASYLQIMRRVVVGSPSPSCGRPPCQPSEDEPGEDDQDYEAMSRVPNPTVDSSPDEVEIEYHVILSATYNVPILYVVRASRAGRILSMDSKSIPELLAQLVAPLHGSHGSDFSGALTMMYHPYLDQPCFFVHPCETSRAMADLAAHFVSDETNYLTTWMSIVGGAAGLRLPVGVHSSQPTKLVDAT